ncbi:hypothetical protein HPB50_005110 [Hyalomma asiaticum]|uniref:Uncharacterized protein n=1 Tax=Hyalomma asiaticum TaxID=266040 RepID=A0ACB7SVU2_HYAAI|nr:hypothetical protein HPB50_005110 [Hyalomma asiaticum]
MSWQTTFFFTSLGLWTVAVLFVAPETQQTRTAWRRSGVRAQENLLHTWRNAMVALLCAAVMSTAYCKLRLYLDETADALAAARTGLNPYNVSDGRCAFGNDKVTMTRSVLNCHDRVTDFLASYSNEVAAMEDKLRTGIRTLIEDIGSWHKEMSVITNELRSVSTAPPSTAPPNVTESPDQAGPGNGGSGGSSPQGLVMTKGPGDRSMLVTKNRRQGRHPSGSSSGGGTERPTRPLKLGGAQADRDIEEVEVWPPTVRAQAARNNAMPSSRNARHSDTMREATILNVRRRTTNSRNAGYSPPEPHGFDDPRPQADNVRVELEERGGHAALPPKQQQQRDERTPTGTPPVKSSEEGSQLVPWTGEAWTGGDDIVTDIAPSPKDDLSDYRATSMQHLPQRNEHDRHRERKEHMEAKRGDDENTGDRL